MGDSMSAAADMIDQYNDLCARFGQLPQYSHNGVPVDSHEREMELLAQEDDELQRIFRGMSPNDITRYIARRREEITALREAWEGNLPRLEGAVKDLKAKLEITEGQLRSLKGALERLGANEKALKLRTP